MPEHGHQAGGDVTAPVLRLGSGHGEAVHIGSPDQGPKGGLAHRDRRDVVPQAPHLPDLGERPGCLTPDLVRRGWAARRKTSTSFSLGWNCEDGRARNRREGMGESFPELHQHECPRCGSSSTSSTSYASWEGPSTRSAVPNISGSARGGPRKSAP